MRHVLVHDYYQIEPKEVWKVIREDLHPLRDQVAHYLTEVDWDEWEKNEVVYKKELRITTIFSCFSNLQPKKVVFYVYNQKRLYFCF